MSEGDQFHLDRIAKILEGHNLSSAFLGALQAAFALGRKIGKAEEKAATKTG
jgi:hypothetical protein